MRTAALLFALLLMAFAAPLVAAGEGHDEGTAEPAAEAHDATGVSGPEMQPGEAWSFNITEDGTFDYHCHPHPWMLAQLRVLPANGTGQNHTIGIIEPEGEDFENWTFSPKTYDVRVGDTVTWVNQGSVMHRVTQTVGEHIAHVGTLGGAEDAHDDSEVQAGGAEAQAAEPSRFWWIVVAVMGVGLVVMFVKGGKKAP